MPGIRRLRRPETDNTPAFDLAYVRTGPPSGTPIVVVPGGPGLASVLPYRALRRWAARGGLDLIMIEHRGVGFSRSDLSGASLPTSAMWVADVIADIAAVLDAEGVRSAHIVGSSYGSYLASSFGARYPDRVSGMILDSALQSAGQLVLERERVRQLFWDADDDLARSVRRLIDRGVDGCRVLDVIRAAYELGGNGLARWVATRWNGRPRLVRKALEVYSGRDESIARVPWFYEFEVAGAIGFRELDYGAPLDGHPLDPAHTYAALADRFPRFVGEPFDLLHETRSFTWPTVLVVGERDVRTPPAAALQVADGMTDATVVRIDNGHSALDTHPAVLLNAMRQLSSGTPHRLAAMTRQLDRLPRVGLTNRFAALLEVGARLEASALR